MMVNEFYEKEEITFSQTCALPTTQPLNFKQYVMELTTESGRVMQKIVHSIEQANTEMTILSRCKADPFVKYRILPVVIASEELHEEIDRLLYELAYFRVDQETDSIVQQAKNESSKLGEASKTITDNEVEIIEEKKGPEEEISILTELMPTADAHVSSNRVFRPKMKFIKLDSNADGWFTPKTRDGKYRPLVNLNNSFSENHSEKESNPGIKIKHHDFPKISKNIKIKQEREENKSKNITEEKTTNKNILNELFPTIAEANEIKNSQMKSQKNSQYEDLKIPDESPAGVKTRSVKDLSQFKIDELPPYKGKKNETKKQRAKTKKSSAKAKSKVSVEGSNIPSQCSEKMDSSAHNKKKVRFFLPSDGNGPTSTNNEINISHNSIMQSVDDSGKVDSKLQATPIVEIEKINPSSFNADDEILANDVEESIIQPGQSIDTNRPVIEPEINIVSHNAGPSSDSDLDTFEDSVMHIQQEQPNVTAQTNNNMNNVDDPQIQVHNTNPETAPEIDDQELETVETPIDDTDNDPDFNPNSKDKRSLANSSDSEFEEANARRPRIIGTSRTPKPAQQKNRKSLVNVNDSADNYGTCPTHTCREGDTLKITFPIAATLKCPETNCIFQSFQEYWPRKVNKIKTHLEGQHRIPINNIERWCSMCQSPLPNPRKIARHRCWKDDPNYGHVMLTPEEFERMPYKCVQCNQFAADNSKALRSHARIHERDGRRKNRGKFPSNTNRNLATPNVNNNSIQDNTNLQEDSESSESHSQNLPSDSQRITAAQEQIGEDEYAEPDENENDGAQVSDDELQNQFLSGINPDPNNIIASDQFVNRLKDMLAGYTPDRWNEFNSLVEEIIAAAQEHVKIKDKETTFTIRNGDPRDPTTTQRTYRRNRRRAMRTVKGEQNKYCNVNIDDLREKFFNNESPQPDLSIYSNCTKAERPPSAAIFSSYEVKRKLKASENTAPGPDRLTYNHLKSFDPHAKVLALIYNICLKAKRIPTSWKQSTTIFIPKKGDLSRPENWRPVALSSTIYKLFAALVSKRISGWLEKNQLLARNQKGFRPFDGALENNFVLETRIQEARRLKKELFVMLLDLKDAFGSLAHPAIFAALEAAGIGDIFGPLFLDMYSGMTTRIMTAEGLSDEIPVERGVKQGCPLSGLIFNITINPVYAEIQDGRWCLFGLGYADDTAVLDKTIEALQATIDRVKAFMDRLGLQLNPAKCVSLHIMPKGNKCGPAKFKIGNVEVPSLATHEETLYLGKPVGYRLLENEAKMDDFIATGVKILNSSLAPWQKLDAMKCFFYPSLSYAMRTSQYGKEAWTRLDSTLKPLYKEVLGLPTRACNSYLYGSTEDGLLGIPLAAFDSDVAHVDTAFKLLMSEDDEVQSLAWEALFVATRDRIGRKPSLQDMQEYLSNQTYKDTSNRYTSIWAKARIASRRLDIVWVLANDKKVTILKGDKAITDRRKIFSTLREIYRKSHTHNLKTLKSQGKTLPCFSAAKASTHFIRTGDYLRFTDWKFIHAARLNVLDLNGTIPGKDRSEKGCRWCEWPNETLPHVLDHCRHALKQKITDRHDKVVQRIKKAASGKWNVLKEDQPFGKNRKRRPDLILTNGNDEALVIDITIPFDNGLDAFNDARAEKIKKYQDTVRDLKEKYKKVTCDAIVVGALGSWDKQNDKIVNKLCSKKYATTMRKLIVSDCIRTSRDIYIEHVTDIEQTDNRSRFKFRKRVIYPSQIIDEWYEGDDAFPSRAKIPAHGFTQPTPEDMDDLEILSEYDSADDEFSFECNEISINPTSTALNEIHSTAQPPSIHPNVDPGDEIFADPLTDSSQNDETNINDIDANTFNDNNALSVSEIHNVDFIGPPHPPSNTVATTKSTDTREVCNKVQIFTPTFEIALASDNSQDPLSVGVRSCLDGAAQSVCLFGGACSCANGAAQPPPSSPGSDPASAAALGPDYLNSALDTPPSAETHKVDASGGVAKTENFSVFCKEGCSPSGE